MLAWEGGSSSVACHGTAMFRAPKPDETFRGMLEDDLLLAIQAAARPHIDNPFTVLQWPRVVEGLLRPQPPEV